MRDSYRVLKAVPKVERSIGGTRTKKSNSCVADKRRLFTRLRRIEGQARGHAKMVEEDRYCIDVLQQIASLRAAADGVGLMLLLRDHVDGCLRQAMEAGCAPEKIDEVWKLSGVTAAADPSME